MRSVSCCLIRFFSIVEERVPLVPLTRTIGKEKSCRSSSTPQNSTMHYRYRMHVPGVAAGFLLCCS